MTDGGTTPIESVEIVDETAARPRRKRRTGMWLGITIPAGLVVAGAVVSSLVLIAPGVAIAGTPVGFHTAGAAKQAIEDRVANAAIEIDGVEFTGAQLGAQVDAAEAAEKAFEDHPLWKITDWNPSDPYAPTVTIDRDTAIEALKKDAPDLFVAPVDASVEFSDGKFVAVAAEAGSGPDLDALAESLSTALVSSEGGIDVSADAVEIAATTTTKAAKAEAKSLNKLAKKAGFYADGDRVVDVSAEQIASWIDVEPDGEGGFAVTANDDAAASVQNIVDTLPGLVDREPTDVTQIVNTSGDVLQGDEGTDGWKLKSTDGVAAAFVDDLVKGDDATGEYSLDVEVVKADVTQLERRLVADLSDLKVYAYENGKVVKTFPMSPGKAGNETDQGNFTVYAKLDVQNMGNEDTSKPPYYYTPNVKYVMYFNGSEGFHGTYWHNEFGIQPMSHGCVNLSESDAKWLFDWTPYGTEVQVRA